MLDSSDQLSWKDLAEQKEKEWKQFTQRRIDVLESAFKEKDKELCDQKTKFIKLKDDFKYNLKLLQERDQELERYDAVLTQLRAEVNSKNSEISDVKMRLDEMRNQLKQEQKGREELQIHYQQRLKENQNEVDSYRFNKDVEFSEERKQFEEFKRNLENKLTKLDVELEVQKRELTSSFEEALKKRETEYRMKEDDMNAKVLEHELKAKILAKELEFSKESQKQVTDNFSEVENTSRLLEKQLKEKEWEITDTKAMKDAKITDLEAQVKQLEMNLKRREENYQSKHSDLDKTLREREEALATLKSAFLEKEQTFVNEIRDLQSKLETADIKIRKLEWANQDIAKEKEIITKNLTEEIRELQEKWNRNLADMSASQVSRDLEMHCLRENDSKLKTEILQKDHAIEKYKKEKAEWQEKEAALIRSRTQLELDWQNRYEALKNAQYENTEDIMHKMAVSKSEHGQSDRGSLIEQNQSLKHVISQMKQQMELLEKGKDSDNNNSGVRQSDASKAYVRNMEEQILTLKQQVRNLQDSKMHHTKQTESSVPLALEVDNNPVLKEYIQSLNKQIDTLKCEKLDVDSKYQKLESRLDNLESSANNMPQNKKYNGFYTSHEDYNVPTSEHDMKGMRRELKRALKLITHLTKENNQLIEASNRPQTEHANNDILSFAPNFSSHSVNHSTSSIARAKNPSQVTEESRNRLNQLEKLQYQLTKQELQFAQNFSPPKVIESVQSIGDYSRPQSILKKSSSSTDMLPHGEVTPDDYVNGQVVLSSAGGESLQEVWRMLEDGSSPVPSARTPRFLQSQSSHLQGNSARVKTNVPRDLSVEGKKAELVMTDDRRSPSRQANFSHANTKLKKTQKTKVRNYNMRDNDY